MIPESAQQQTHLHSNMIRTEQTAEAHVSEAMIEQHTQAAIMPFKEENQQLKVYLTQYEQQIRDLEDELSNLNE